MNSTFDDCRARALAIAAMRPEPGTDVKAFLARRARGIREAFGTIAPARTETVTVADLKEDDVIIELGDVTFPFPFVLDRVTELTHQGEVHARLLGAAHGWFTPCGAGLEDRAVRLTS